MRRGVVNERASNGGGRRGAPEAAFTHPEAPLPFAPPPLRHLAPADGDTRYAAASPVARQGPVAQRPLPGWQVTCDWGRVPGAHCLGSGLVFQARRVGWLP